LGIGRIGAIIGPVIGGVLIAQHVATPSLFLIAGAVSLGASAAVFGIARVTSRRNPAQFFATPANGRDLAPELDPRTGPAQQTAES
jgi:AAHS family 4-hydroxybenzoate transporter-like MFS transporter